MTFNLRHSLFAFIATSAIALTGCGGDGDDPKCGNSILEDGEACDLGLSNGPNSTCSILCTTQDLGVDDDSCGNGIVEVDLGELCEPADAATAVDPITGVACNADTCTYEVDDGGIDGDLDGDGDVDEDDELLGGGVGGGNNLLCGNGVLDLGEECDPLDPATASDPISGAACDSATCVYGGGAGVVTPVDGPVIEVLCNARSQRIELDTRQNFTNNAYPTYSCTNLAMRGPENTVAITVPYDAEIELDIDERDGSRISGAVMYNAVDPLTCAGFFENKVTIEALAGSVVYVVFDSETIDRAGEYVLDIECDEIR